MSIVRTKKKKNKGYTVLENTLLQNQEMTYEARGLLCYLLSKPDDWECRTKDLQKAAKAGRDKVLRILKELESFGHARYETIRNEKGHLLGKTWTIHEEPINRKPENTVIGNRFPEKPKIGKTENRKTPTSGKHGPIQSKEFIQSKEVLKNKEEERANESEFEYQISPFEYQKEKEKSSAQKEKESPQEFMQAFRLKLQTCITPDNFESCARPNRIEDNYYKVLDTYLDYLISRNCQNKSDEQIIYWLKSRSSMWLGSHFTNTFITNYNKYHNPDGQVKYTAKEQAHQRGIKKFDQLKAIAQQMRESGKY